MSYVVLARKWRPQTFDDLVGQEHVSRTLANAIASDRVAHAFLFTGVRGVGKTTSARILAKTLNCEKGPTATPCLSCHACTEIGNGMDVDVQEIDGASYTGVDAVRSLQETIPYRPQRDRFKIYIVDEVHMLSTAAWNAFLKTLEEPPPHVKFIFATTEVNKVPVTILSRCQRYDFKLIASAEIAARLKHVLAAEKVDADDEVTHIIAREAAGSMRDAMSLLDQVIAWVGGSAERLDAAGVARVLGVAARSVLHQLSAAVVDHDPATCLKVVADLAEQGYSLANVARDFLEQLRDLVVAKVGKNPDQLISMADEELADVKALAARSEVDDLSRLYLGFSRAFDDIARSAQPRAAFEMALVRLAHRPPLVPIDELLRRLADLEQRLAAGSGSSGAGSGGTSASGSSGSGRSSGSRAGNPGGSARAGSAGAAPAAPVSTALIAPTSAAPAAPAETAAPAAPAAPAETAATAGAAPRSHAPSPTAPRSHAPSPTAPSPTAPRSHGPSPTAPSPTAPNPTASRSHGPSPAAPNSAASNAAPSLTAASPAADLSGQNATPGPPAGPSARQPSPRQPSPRQPSPGQPSPAQPSPAQPSPGQPSPHAASPNRPHPPVHPPAARLQPSSLTTSPPSPNTPPHHPHQHARPAAVSMSVSSTSRPSAPTPERQQTPADARREPRSPLARQAAPTGPDIARAPSGTRPGQEPPPAPNAPAMDPALLATWESVLDIARGNKPAVASIFDHAAALEVASGRIVVAFEPASFLLEQARRPESIELLTAAASEHFGARTEVVFDEAGRHLEVQSVAAKNAFANEARLQAARQRVAEHPLVVAAVNVLGAELREVKLAEHP